jgi:hypothetical protein
MKVKARTRFVMFYLLNMLPLFDHFKKHFSQLETCRCARNLNNC